MISSDMEGFVADGLKHRKCAHPITAATSGGERLEVRPACAVREVPWRSGLAEEFVARRGRLAVPIFAVLIESDAEFDCRLTSSPMLRQSVISTQRW